MVQGMGQNLAHRSRSADSGVARCALLCVPPHIAALHHLGRLEQADVLVGLALDRNQVCVSAFIHRT